MGGGTWIYLGHFDFAKGENAHVELSNLSRKMENSHGRCGENRRRIWQYRPTSRQFAHRRESGKFIYKLFLYDKRLSPFHRSRPLLATMGGIPRKVYSPSQGKTTIPTITNAGENGSIIWQEVRTYCPTVQD